MLVPSPGWDLGQNSELWNGTLQIGCACSCNTVTGMLT